MVKKKPVGWKMESVRHSLARKGIKTGGKKQLHLVRVPYGKKDTPKKLREYTVREFPTTAVGTVDEIKDFVKENKLSADLIIEDNNPVTPVKDDLELKNLGQYYGTEGYHNVMGANVTDGVGYIMQNGYSWFVTDAIVSLRMIPELKNEEFVVVKLKVKDKKAVVTMTDGNKKILYTQKYEYTNAKKDLTLYYQNGVLLLSGEY